jgi:cell wall-associated NlpC family hydrolase
MDCSGLLLNAFNQINFTLPRSSEDQSKVGKEVEMKDLQPGDLVFFATGKKKKKITHVGLVTEVNDKNDVKFIHASSKVGVVEVNIYSEYYLKNFRGARRVIE